MIQVPANNLRSHRQLIEGQPLGLLDDLAAELQGRLPLAGERAVAAIVSEVPGYRGALTGPRAELISAAVQFALAGFIGTATTSRDREGQLQSVLDGAYQLGRDEARSGRSMDALLAAYRVGARVSWRELAETAVEHGADAEVIAQFAALVFAYIDELSAASVAGHSDELTAAELERRRHHDRLAHRLLVGDPVDALTTAAARAGWAPPTTLTVILAPLADARLLRQRLDPATLQANDETAEALVDPDTAVFLVPDAHHRRRDRLLQTVIGALGDSDPTARSVVGPATPWAQATASLARALRTRRLTDARDDRRGAPGRGSAGADADPPAGRGSQVLDSEAHLVELVVTADPDAVADLRVGTFTALADLKPATQARLLETLRSWLLHQGRREAVAEQLFVHPQTVRYRMSQLRDLLGDSLEDPRWCEAAVIALAADRALDPALLRPQSRPLA